MKELEKVLDTITTSIEQMKFDIAEQKLLQLITKYPDDIRILSLLGKTYNAMNQPRKALPYYNKAAKISPDNPDLLFNVADTEMRLSSKASAESKLLHIIATHPEHYNTLTKLGIIYSEQGQTSKAESLFLQAISIDNQKVDAHLGLAKVYESKGLYEKAIHYLENILKVQPHSPTIHSNLATLYILSFSHKKADQFYQKALSLNPNLLLAQHNYLLSLHYNSTYKKKSIFKEHKNWGQKYETGKQHIPLTNVLKISERRLRIGYVSGDFRQHAVGLFIMPLIVQHNRLDYEPYLYCTSRQTDNVTRKFMSLVPSSWRDISTLNDDQAADLIANEKIDILIDLTGHTANSRLGIFARKPAPIQMTYLGYPDTTGLQTIDYRLTDEYSDPTGSESLYTEQLLRIPECFICTSEFLKDLPPQRFRNSPSEIVFGSFNLSSKINSQVIRLWSNILRSVPQSTLLLKTQVLADKGVVKRIKKLFAEEGVEENRLRFAGHLPTYDEHLDYYNSIDIALDTFPYNGTTTTIEALSMGCPVITLVGNRHSARVGYSILKNCGLEELITWSEDEYVAKAQYLANNYDYLLHLKQSINQKIKRSTLADSKGFTRKVEGIYRNVWLEWCKKNGNNEPAVISVKNNIKVCVPDSLKLMTPFVLREQENWFEKEDLAFLLKYLQSGSNAIDIGANYGMYTLNFAKKIGENGKVIAFEPSSATSAYLKMSVKENDLTNVKVYGAGLSNCEKIATLNLDDNSELNSIRLKTPSNQQEIVSLLALDNIKEIAEIDTLDLIKMDAEGEEESIIRGATTTLAKQSPLIMYELLHGTKKNTGLVAALQDCGYNSYYLIPILGMLIPYQTEMHLDPSVLNLYACKADLAKHLESNKLLSQEIDFDVPHIYDEVLITNYFSNHTCYESISPLWKTNHYNHDENRTSHLTALCLYIQAKDTSLAPSTRAGLFLSALSIIKSISEAAPTLPRLLSLTRIAVEAGERDYATQILEIIYGLFNNGEQISIDEEHLAISSKYENIAPQDAIGEWYLSSIIELLIKSEYYSSYFDQSGKHINYLNLLKTLGFQSPEMERRRQLLLMKNKSHEGPIKSDILNESSPANLNQDWWIQR